MRERGGCKQVLGGNWLVLAGLVLAGLVYPGTLRMVGETNPALLRAELPGGPAGQWRLAWHSHETQLWVGSLEVFRP